MSALLTHGMELLLMDEGNERADLSGKGIGTVIGPDPKWVDPASELEPVLEDADPSEALGAPPTDSTSKRQDEMTRRFKKLATTKRKAPAQKPAGRPLENGSHKAKPKTSNRKSSKKGSEA